jgi:hypothetical protein
LESSSSTTIRELVMEKSGLVRFPSKFREPRTKPTVRFSQQAEPLTGPLVQSDNGLVLVQEGFKLRTGPCTVLKFLLKIHISLGLNGCCFDGR